MLVWLAAENSVGGVAFCMWTVGILKSLTSCYFIVLKPCEGSSGSWSYSWAAGSAGYASASARGCTKPQHWKDLWLKLMLSSSFLLFLVLKLTYLLYTVDLRAALRVQKSWGGRKWEAESGTLWLVLDTLMWNLHLKMIYGGGVLNLSESTHVNSSSRIVAEVILAGNREMSCIKGRKEEGGCFAGSADDGAVRQKWPLLHPHVTPAWTSWLVPDTSSESYYKEIGKCALLSDAVKNKEGTI